jgi:4-hydroxy-2-oxoheptanedioate aldolase
VTSFAERLRSKPLLGTWCTFASFASAEVMARLGFDFVVLDMQHGELSQAQFPALLGAFHEAGCTPVVRAPENRYHIINWLFDQGAPAVLVPMVNSPARARRAIAASKYPPTGRKSFGPLRASEYSARSSEYLAAGDAACTLIIQVESETAVNRIDEILAVPGIDAVFMGPNDLAFSRLGPGQTLGAARTPDSPTSGWTGFARTPEVLDLCERVRLAAATRGLPFGMTSASVQEAREWMARGAFATFVSDFLFMQSGAAHLCCEAR